MNAKTAKRLRREANYHPKDLRSYDQKLNSRKPYHYTFDNEGKATCNYGTFELKAECSRSLYQELKKEVIK